ncbi:MAG TPA: hypothetical protein VFD58_20515 [Blastocatellia bacterium]|nr:hypothetical protein [Blastocatellia bacterium]
MVQPENGQQSGCHPDDRREQHVPKQAAACMKQPEYRQTDDAPENKQQN